MFSYGSFDVSAESGLLLRQLVAQHKDFRHFSGVLFTVWICYCDTVTACGHQHGAHTL